jgi:glycosyltransferase involved in cell wall biosynthesis
MHLRLFLKAIGDSNIVFNCNWFGIHGHVKSIKRLCKFKYFSILHSNIDWVIQNTIPFDACIDKYYSINQTIVSAFVKKGIRADKFTVIPNCVDTANIFQKGSISGIREKIGIDGDDLVLGMTTRIAPDKNVLDVVRLLEEVNKGGINASLVVLGGAPDNESCLKYEQRLKQLCEWSIYSHKIKLAGKLPTEEIYRLQTCFDVAINVSPSEGLPISLLEQMAAGIYCMYPGVGEIPEVLLGLGFVGYIKQRLTAQEIYKSPNYTDEELKQWVDHLLGLTRDKIDQTSYEASEYIRKYRSYDVWKNKFIHFLNS